VANFGFTFSPVNVDAGGNAWVDPPATLPNPYGGTFSIPSRQNARSGLPHRYTRFLVGVMVEVLLNPIGTSGLVLDSGLGGNTFQGWFAEVPNGAFIWSSIAGISAYKFFTPTARGAYCSVFSRPSGGGIVWHFMVE
jgi:hypothetical protein